MLITSDGMAAAAADGGAVLTLAPESDGSALEAAARHSGVVRIAFSAMGDGRGFSLARRLRAAGFEGRLRAAGPLIADQFAALARVGFDEVELAPESAVRLPAGASLRAPAGYRERLLNSG